MSHQIMRAVSLSPKPCKQCRGVGRNKTLQLSGPKLGPRRNKHTIQTLSQEGTNVKESFLTGPLAWRGDQMTKEKYVHVLSPEEIQELEDSMRKFKASNLHFGHISQETFPLPISGPVFRQWSREVHNVHGLLIVRGLEPAKYTPDEFVLMHAGISSWIANKRGVQTGNASKPEERYVALHVTDQNLEEIRKITPNRFVPSANTNALMPFHTDSGDVISLAYRQLSQTGGEVRVASGWAVYNEMLRDCPDVIETLRKPYPWDMVGNVPDRAFHGLLHETFDSNGERQITLMAERRPFFGDKYCPRLESLPELTNEQKHALEMVQKIAARVCTTVSLEVGDILFVNNRAMLHARSSFVDLSLDPSLRRHAIRLLLRDDEYSWPIPQPLEHRYQSMFESTENPEDEVWGIGAFIWGTGAQHG